MDEKPRSQSRSRNLRCRLLLEGTPVTFQATIDLARNPSIASTRKEPWPRRFPLSRRLIAVSSLLLILGCGPLLLLPGGKLDGEQTTAPSDWSFSDEVNTVQLETRPEDPYSVNIWAVGMGPLLYVHAGANRSSWVEHMEANSDVRVRIEDELYELRASRVEGPDEFKRFSDAYEQKYGSRPRNENVAEAYLFRLEAR